MTPDDPSAGDGILAAAIFALDPAGTGGVRLRAAAGPARDRWIEAFRALAPAVPIRRLPHAVAHERLLGGIDLTATLNAGRPVAEQGLLAGLRGAVLIVPMAERLAPGTASIIGNALEQGAVTTECPGFSETVETAFGVLALDEGEAADEQPPDALLDRLAIHLEVPPLSRPLVDLDALRWQIDAARARLPDVVVPGQILESLIATAQALGIPSMRPARHALAVARASAALSGSVEVGRSDAEAAARLVLAPRARCIPVPPQPPPPAPESEPEASADEVQSGDQQMADRVLEAAAAALPPHLLAALKANQTRGMRPGGAGKSGERQRDKRHGRAIGARRGELRSGARLDLMATLRAAAPWQRLRRRPGATARRIEVRAEDFRVTVLEQRKETTTIFVVDASGSSALHRLAEAKGAVELLLEECYVRRDRVALIAFRGLAADIVLPPTRSLVRAKRSLAGLPGGGGTPLAAGLDASAALALATRREGRTPILVVMTDGRANIARDGKGDRRRAEADADAAAKVIAAAGLTSLLIDTSPRPQKLAQHFAETMAGTYLPMPQADAQCLSRHVQQAIRG